MFRWKDKKISSSLDRAKLVRNFFAYLVLMAALGAMVFFGVCSTPMQRDGTPKGAAAKIGNQEISYDEFRRAYENTYSRYQRVYQDAFDPAALQLAKMVLESLVDQRILYSEAKHLGMTVSDHEIEKQIVENFKDEKTGKFSAEQFSNVLRYNGFSESSFMDQMRRDLTINRYRELINQTAFVSTKSAELDYQIDETKLDVDFIKLDDSNVKISVTDEEVKKFLDEAGQKNVKDYYEKNTSEFNKPPKVHARHILISFKGAKRAPKEVENRSKEEARARAEKILAEVKTNSTGFAAIASKETDELSGKSKGGDLGFFAREDMAKEFSDAAFSLKPGDVSGVVESPFGFHIIKVEGVQPEVKKSLADATEGIARKLIEKQKKPQEIGKAANALYAELKAGKAASDLMKSYNVEWKSTGAFAANAQSIPKLGSNGALMEAILVLKKPGDYADHVVDADGSKYILRLKNRTNANLVALEPSKRVELARNAAYMQANSIFTSLKEKAEKKLRDNGDIKLNEDYLAIDQRHKDAGSH